MFEGLHVTTMNNVVTDISDSTVSKEDNNMVWEIAASCKTAKEFEEKLRRKLINQVCIREIYTHEDGDEEEKYAEKFDIDFDFWFQVSAAIEFILNCENITEEEFTYVEQKWDSVDNPCGFLEDDPAVIEIVARSVNVNRLFSLYLKAFWEDVCIDDTVFQVLKKFVENGADKKTLRSFYAKLLEYDEEANGDDNLWNRNSEFSDILDYLSKVVGTGNYHVDAKNMLDWSWVDLDEEVEDEEDDCFDEDAEDDEYGFDDEDEHYRRRADDYSDIFSLYRECDPDF